MKGAAMLGFLFGGKPPLPGTLGTRSYKTATQNKADGPPGPGPQYKTKCRYSKSLI